MERIRKAIQVLPTFLLAFALAVAVWISAVTSADPIEERIYPRPVPLEVIGQDSGLVLTNNLPTQISLTLSAPSSIWDRMSSDTTAVRALVDLSGLGAGQHLQPVQVQISMQPVEIISYTPSSVNLSLEPLASRTLPVRLITRGETAVGFQAELPTLSQSGATISGPASLVSRVQEVRAALDLNRANQSINRTLNLMAVDANELAVEGVTISPDRVTVSQNITQRGGYRNVVVKVLAIGQVANGYRLTNISVSPPAVTVFSTNPQDVENLPGYVETEPIDLTNIKDDRDLRPRLNLPPNISVVGDQTVLVQVGVAAIEGSVTLSNMKVEIIGLKEGLSASSSPERVDVIFSGPLYLLDKLTPKDIRVVVEMNGEDPGIYQRVPRVDLGIPELNVQSILPGSLEIVVYKTSSRTATPTLPARLTVTPTPMR